jgi:hypothetical protein
MYTLFRGSSGRRVQCIVGKAKITCTADTEEVVIGGDSPENHHVKHCIIVSIIAVENNKPND